MELASMIAREPLSEHRLCVCRAIAAFLRAYNDRIDDGRRQNLYRIAALVVGTRGSAAGSCAARAIIRHSDATPTCARSRSFKSCARWHAGRRTRRALTRRSTPTGHPLPSACSGATRWGRRHDRHVARLDEGACG
jgi:hypothetical protein